MGEALALGDAGQQRFDGAHKLIGVDAQGGKGGAVGHDILGLLGLFAGKICLTGGHILRQHLLQLRDLAGVVQSTDSHRAEVGIGQLFKEFF